MVRDSSKNNSFGSRKLVEPDGNVDDYFLEDKNIVREKNLMRKRLGMSSSVSKFKKPSVYESLKIHLYRAGLESDPEVFIKLVFKISLILLVISVFSLGLFCLYFNYSWLTIVLLLVFWSVLGFVFLYSICISVAKIYLDYLIFKRKLEVEKVLPEFLRLVATNYRSGLSLDEALLKSNRDRFGVLSKEISIVSKTARVKGNLARALEIFGKKYDSRILERAMNNLSMSISSGSNVSSLLEEIADNITKMRNMRAGMAANVKNYIIFIIVAGVIIAPFMFAMSYHMNSTIVGIKTSISSQQSFTSGATTLDSIKSGGGILPSNFDVFAFLMLFTNSFVSGFVISMIMYGNYQQGFKRIPVYLVVSLLLYFVGKNLLSVFMTFI